MNPNPIPVRGRIAGLGLALGPVLLAIGGTTTPSSGDSGSSIARTVIAHPDRWFFGWSVVVLGCLVTFAGLAHLAGHLPRRARVATTGIVLYAIGLTGYIALAGAEIVLTPMVGDGSAASSEAIDRIGDSRELGAVFVAYLPGVLFGALLLFVGLGLARVLPRWAAVLGVAGVIGGFFLGDSLPFGSVIAGVVVAAAFSPVLLSRQNSLVARHMPGPDQPTRQALAPTHE